MRSMAEIARKTPVSRPAGKAYGGDEEANRDEGQGQACSESDRPQAMLALSRAEHDRQERQHTGRKRGEHAGKKR